MSEKSKSIYNDKPAKPPTQQQQENRAKAIMLQAQLKEKVARGFDLGSAATSGAYEVND